MKKLPSRNFKTTFAVFLSVVNIWTSQKTNYVILFIVNNGYIDLHVSNIPSHELTKYINEINQFEHHKNYNTNIYEP